MLQINNNFYNPYHCTIFLKRCASVWHHLRRKMRIWSHLLKKSLMENFIFRAVNYIQEYLRSSFVRITWGQ